MQARKAVPMPYVRKLPMRPYLSHLLLFIIKIIKAEIVQMSNYFISGFLLLIHQFLYFFADLIVQSFLQRYFLLNILLLQTMSLMLLFFYLRLFFFNLQLVFLPVNFCLPKTSPESKVVENDPCSHGNIKARCFFCVLRNIDKKIANFFVNRYQSSSFISQKKCCTSRERMFLDWCTSLSYLNTTYFNSLLMKLFSTGLQRSERLVLDLFIGALITEHVELFEYFSFFRVGSACDEEHLIKSESASTPYNVTNIVAFANIVEQQISLRFIFLHKIRLCYQHCSQQIQLINQYCPTLQFSKQVQISFNTYPSVATAEQTKNTTALLLIFFSPLFLPTALGQRLPPRSV